MNTESWRCVQCGMEVAQAVWPYALCPRCLMAMGKKTLARTRESESSRPLADKDR